MPDRVPGIHVLPYARNVNGRDKPGHDVVVYLSKQLYLSGATIVGCFQVATSIFFDSMPVST
ncbi:MAG: hypothetical protein JWQ24_2515 [Tardiphaga sp.]|nr:hypothetical protein [Tardiphaga sp.]